MPITASNPIYQTMGQMGTLKPITWDDVFNDDEKSDDLQTDLETNLLSGALDSLEVGDSGSEAKEVPLKVTEIASTEPKELSCIDLDPIHSNTSLHESSPIPSIASSPSSSSSSSSSSDEIPSTLESKRRHCIGVGVYALSETLKLGKVGRVERPTIYHQIRNEDGSYSDDNIIPIRNVGEVPSEEEINAALSIASSSNENNNNSEKTMMTKNVKFTSPMMNAVQKYPFEPRGGGVIRSENDAQNHGRWHESSTYRSIEDDNDVQQYQEHRANFAPFRTNRRYTAQQRTKMQPQVYNQMQMRNHAGSYQVQSQVPPIQWHNYNHSEGNGQWHEQQRQSQRQMSHQHSPYQNNTYEKVDPNRLPPHASLYGLLPNQAYDMSSSSANSYRHRDHMPIQHHYEQGRPIQYDPAPHQAHWRGNNMYAQAESPLKWVAGERGIGAGERRIVAGENAGESVARGANAIPLACRNESRYSSPSSEAEIYRPAPEIWRRDVDLIKKGILHRTS